MSRHYNFYVSTAAAQPARRGHSSVAEGQPGEGFFAMLSEREAFTHELVNPRVLDFGRLDFG
ncbi:MAG: hypothetical protein WEA61_01085, partial [Anaerolineales bacterium]